MKYVYGQRVKKFKDRFTSLVASLVIMANSAGLAIPVLLTQTSYADSGSEEITSVQPYLNSSIRGIQVDTHVKPEVTNVKEIKVEILRADSTKVTKISRPSGSAITGLNGPSNRTTTPFIIQQGTYDEAGSSSWLPAPGLWNTDTAPVSATSIITLADDTVLTKTASFSSTLEQYEALVPKFVKIDAYYVKNNYKGIGVDIHVNNLIDATGVEVRVDRANGGAVIKTNKPTGGVIGSLNTDAPAATTAPIVIQQGTYNEAGSSSWNQPAATWSSNTVPTQITVTISRSGGSSLVKTISLSDVSTPFATLSEVMPPDTEAPQAVFTSPVDGSEVMTTDVTGIITDNDSVTQYSFNITGPESWSTKKWTPNASNVDFNLNLCEEDRLNVCNENSLPDGEYKVRVAAYDGNGNRDITSNITFTLDRTPPTFSLTDDGNPHQVITDGSIINPEKLADKDNNGDAIRFSKESASDVLYVNDTKINSTGYVGNKSGQVGWKFNNEGTYVVYTKDAAGNQSNSITFTVDKTAPDRITGMTIKQGINVLGCSATIKDRKITVDWNDSNETNIRYEYHNKDKSLRNDLTVSEFTGTIRDEDGYYMYKVRAIDAAGNVGEWSDWCGVTLDKTSPVATITAPATDNQEVSGIVSVTGEVIDANIKTHWFEITGPNGYITHKHFNSTNSTQSFNWDTSGLEDGTYKIRYVATDKANNRNDDPNYTNPTLRFVKVNNSPTLTADYFTVHANQLGVGFSIDKFDDATSVEVALYDVSDNLITKNIGDSTDIITLLNSTTGQLSSPFYIPFQTATDGYWQFGNADWASVTPAYAIVTVNYGGGQLTDRVDFVSANQDNPSQTYEALVASLPEDEDDKETTTGGTGGGDGGAAARGGGGTSPQEFVTGAAANTAGAAQDLIIVNNDDEAEEDTPEDDGDEEGAETVAGASTRDDGKTLGSSTDEEGSSIASWWWVVALLAAGGGFWLFAARKAADQE